jgi:ABC1 atypical kinase-like domain
MMMSIMAKCSSYGTVVVSSTQRFVTSSVTTVAATAAAAATRGSSSNCAITPILLTINCCRRCWMGPMQSLYCNNRYFSMKHSIRYYSQRVTTSLQRPQQPMYDGTFHRISSLSTTRQIMVGHEAQRIQKNVARLYARRILEIAAASAALQRCKLQQMTLLEDPQRMHTKATSIERPADWENWSRREWSNELLRSLGTNTISRLWSATQRIVSLTCLVLPFTILYPLSYVSPTVEQFSWKYALWSIEQAGPTYIKLFQWATTRQDLFTSEFCHYFSQLQDHTVGHTWKETLEILQQDLSFAADLQQPLSSSLLSESIETIPTAASNTTTTTAVSNRSKFHVVNEYISLDPKPIGSGCIAQVYRGTLMRPIGKYDAGTEIAVKVQHPGIWHKVCVDFYIMNIGARMLEAIPFLNLQYLSLVDSVRKFRDIMLPQLDLTIEAQHLERFNRDFNADPSVSFPMPLHDLTNTRVLTETFIHGSPILQYANASESDRKELALLGLNTTLKMIFLNDFLHGTMVYI